MSSHFLITTVSGFESDAQQEVKKALGKATARKTFLKGLLLVDTPLEENEAVALLRDAETYLVARVLPFQQEVRISKGPEGVAQLVDEVMHLENLPAKGEKFRVVCERRGEHEFKSRDVEFALGKELEEKNKAVFGGLDLKEGKIVSVQILQNLAYIGSSPFSHFVNKNPANVKKYEEGERPFTRAFHKLAEAFENFELPQKGVALDIGSAPGGWVKVLLEKGFEVYAVDPAELSPELAGEKGFTHFKMRAEELLNQNKIPKGSLDLLTFDANIEPKKAAEICNEVAPLLKSSAPIVVTFKKTRPGPEVVDEGLEELEKKFEVKAIKRLQHNKQELTIYAIKRA
ncbi:MAG TPA: SAM-dependent methyltransferase [Candidatus Norongarragalinales archaeon]|jgi:tRNA(Ser,Leu) C12 N-acetylase TAN1|nr:SAM-dependent methyltransferase [Candidatus Norongarragalinales archaeon]